MKPQILEHHVTIRKNTETNEPCLCLEIAYTDSIGKHQWGFISDIPEDMTEEVKQTFLKTFLHAAEKTEKEKAKKKRQQKKLFNEYKELEKYLKNTKHDEESMKKAVKEYYNNKK